MVQRTLAAGSRARVAGKTSEVRYIPTGTRTDVKRSFHVVIEKDEDGWYVGSVPELPGCHTQARSVEDLRKRIQEAILLYLDVRAPPAGVEFVGVDRVEVSA
jgi:predicted RNase H-like HicB family nuclease